MFSFLPVSAVSPLLIGGPHCSVTLLVVMLVTFRLVGSEGGPVNNYINVTLENY
jgi:hypothetical protein